jgi:hypothetical protein
MVLLAKSLRDFFPDIPFNPSNWGSNSCEELFAKARCFLRHKCNCSHVEFLHICSRILNVAIAEMHVDLSTRKKKKAELPPLVYTGNRRENSRPGRIVTSSDGRKVFSLFLDPAWSTICMLLQIRREDMTKCEATAHRPPTTRVSDMWSWTYSQTYLNLYLIMYVLQTGCL